jgi:hypothetical protein
MGWAGRSLAAKTTRSVCVEGGLNGTPGTVGRCPGVSTFSCDQRHRVKGNSTWPWLTMRALLLSSPPAEWVPLRDAKPSPCLANLLLIVTDTIHRDESILADIFSNTRIRAKRTNAQQLHDSTRRDYLRHVQDLGTFFPDALLPPRFFAFCWHATSNSVVVPDL